MTDFVRELRILATSLLLCVRSGSKPNSHESVRATDSTLLWDVVRVITRLIGQLGELLPEGVSGFTNRTRSARRRMQEIEGMTDKQRQDSPSSPPSRLPSSPVHPS